MPISKEQWAAVSEKLMHLYSSVDFRLDGRKITVQWRCVSVNGQRYSLFIFIDGSLQLGMGWKDSKVYDPFVEKVWRKRSRTWSLIKKTPADCKSKRALAMYNALKKKYPDKITVWYDPFFPSASSLIRQYKTIDGLEVIE